MSHFLLNLFETYTLLISSAKIYMVRTRATAHKSIGGCLPAGMLTQPEVHRQEESAEASAREEPQDIHMEQQEEVPNFEPVRDWEDD